GETSRHPLPEIERIVEKLSTWGIGDGVQVAAYDESGGAIAARLWWMLHWLGHEGVAVLDGGWTEWKRLGLPVSSEASRPPRKEFQANIQPHMLLSTADIMAMRKDGGMLLVDVRDPERYRGEVEPIDTVAGHIPGASNLPYKENLNAEGSFLSPEVLRAKYKSMLDGRPAGRTVFYCGSGVTAAHSLLAMEHAGLGQGRLYADSWSGWIIDTSREIETGEGIK
ncbi:MAG: sulfurtransferase, partial [Anaerolineae bacterium]|nr:sulfurtransferase [Anaerolineae bacterium]